MTKSRIRRVRTDALGLAVLIIPVLPQQAGTPFVPFEGRAFRIVNSVAFTPDDRAVIAALFHREVLAARGRPDSTAGETALYASTRNGDAWSAPELLPFSGRYSDYEPALSPDGSFLVFNSMRPYAGGRVPERNDLWIVERTAGGYGTPRRLEQLTSFDLEESYATIDRELRMIYMRGPAREGTDDFDLLETQLDRNGNPGEPRRLPFSDERHSEGDPQLARDGSFVIFTRWDYAAGWQRTCDLYIAFRRGADWSAPVALTEINTANPDYAPALSSDGRWLYYRAGGSLLRRELGPILDGARARALSP